MSLSNKLIAGDSLNFSTASPDYLPADGWSMTYRFVPRSVGTAFTITSSTADPDDATAFQFTLAGAATSAWVADVYDWVCLVTLGADRYSLDSGEVTVSPNPLTATSMDLRSFAAKALAAIEAYLENPNNLAAANYTIAGRSLSRYPRAELIAERSKWQAEVAREEAAARGAAGLPDRRRVYVRFGPRA